MEISTKDNLVIHHDKTSMVLQQTKKDGSKQFIILNPELQKFVLEKLK